MDTLCNEKCNYCGAPMKPVKWFFQEKANIRLECSADCAKKENMKKNRIEKIKSLKFKYKQIGFTTSKRLKNYNGPYKDTATAFIESLSEKGQAMLLNGNNEEDKITLTEVITKEIFAKGLTIIKMSMYEYLSKFKEIQPFNNGITFEQQANNWLKNSLIIITDFGVGKYSDWEEKNIAHLLKKIIEQRKNLIITARPNDISRLRKSEVMKPIFDLLRPSIIQLKMG